MTILEARGLTYAYPGGVAALDSLSLSIPKGRKLAILGPNGAGKTTVLLHLNGTFQPKSGQVLLDGAPVKYDRAGLAHWRQRVGLVLQDADDQLFAASVFEDVSFGPLNLGLDEDATRQRVQTAMDALCIAHLADRPTHMLSFGQKKRAAIAGAVAMRPDVLLLDEPSAGLDHLSTGYLLDVLQKLNDDGATIVFTTHDADLAYGFADEVALFSNGTVLAQGEATAILSNGDLLEQVKLEKPFLLELGQKARALGLLAPSAPLPRTRRDALALLERVAVSA